MLPLGLSSLCPLTPKSPSGVSPTSSPLFYLHMFATIPNYPGHPGALREYSVTFFQKDSQEATSIKDGSYSKFLNPFSQIFPSPFLFVLVQEPQRLVYFNGYQIMLDTKLSPKVPHFSV